MYGMGAAGLMTAALILGSALLFTSMMSRCMCRNYRYGGHHPHMHRMGGYHHHH